MEDVEDEYMKFLSDNGSIVLNETRLVPQQKEVLKNIWFLSQIGNNDPGTVIVPDAFAKDLRIGVSTLLGKYKDNVDAAAIESTVYSLTNVDGYPLNEPIEDGFYALTKYWETFTYASMVAVPIFSVLYLGIVFLIVCATLIALQQLTEAMDSEKKYQILSILGADSPLLRTVLIKQIGFYFASPLVLAIIIVRMILDKIIYGVGHFMSFDIAINPVATILMFLFVYGSYFFATYLSSRQIIRNI